MREESSSREVQSRRRYYPGETTLNEEPTQSRSQGTARVATQEPGLTKQDVAEIVGGTVTTAVGEAMKKLIESINPEVKPVEQPPQTVQLPIEDVQLAGEKVNYRIALNPEIFFRYSVFKARASSLGNKWEGTLSDFIDLATKDVLTLYGLFPTILTSKGRSFTVEMPQGVQEEPTQ